MPLLTPIPIHNYGDLTLPYHKWVPIFEHDWKCRVLDPDGERAVLKAGLWNVPLTRKEAVKYMLMNTIDSETPSAPFL